ncbi:MAG: DUF4097 family beta strand repeat-containing protein [Eubacteriales bacterium]|nr:DUF4097 family beta strand repeat-containing protein [Eubacteriales bacterium]
MERNISFEANDLKDIVANLAWAQLEIFADSVEKVQIMVAGDEASVNDLRVEAKEGVLLTEQPQYGLSLNLMDSRWLQICIRIPMSWKKGIHCSTISGLLSARKLNGSEIVLETVSGEMRAMKLNADVLKLKTVSGDTRGEMLTAEKLSVRSVSGDMALDALKVNQLKCSSVNGEQTYNMEQAFKSIEVTAVSGNVIVTAPVSAMNVNLRSISGRVRTEGVDITESSDVPCVRVTGVSADLKLISIKE